MKARSDTAGVWTTAYETIDTVWLFVVNTTEQAASPRIALAANLADTLAGDTATDVVSGLSLGVAWALLLAGLFMLRDHRGSS